MPQKFNGKSYYRNTAGYFVSSTYKGKKLSRIHRDVWEHYNGPIPKGYDIHHKDEDKANNDITNLQLMLHAEHSAHRHVKKQKEPLPPFVRVQCLCCSKILWLQRDKVGSRKFCSEICADRHYYKHNEKRKCKCVVCGHSFLHRFKRMTCSTECFIKRRMEISSKPRRKKSS